MMDYRRRVRRFVGKALAGTLISLLACGIVGISVFGMTLPQLLIALFMTCIGVIFGFLACTGSTYELIQEGETEHWRERR